MTHATEAFHVMAYLRACATADELAGQFPDKHRDAVRMAFQEAQARLEPGRLVMLPGLAPAHASAAELERYRTGETVLAVRACPDRAAELWVVFQHQHFDSVEEAEAVARRMAVACRQSSAFAVFRPEQVQETLH